MRKRVVITGIGIVSALGVGAAQNLRRLKEGRTAVAPAQYLSTTLKEFPVGEVPLSDEEMLERMGLSASPAYNRNVLLGMMAMREALADCGLWSCGSIPEEPIAFVNGTTVGGMDMTERYYPELTAEVMAHHAPGDTSRTIASHFGKFDRVETIATACSSATNAVMHGAQLIESGLYDVVVVGGCESLTRYHLNGFKSLMILDTNPCKPFDLHRQGLNLGEGAAYLVLESERHARLRRARMYGEVCGYGNACDAYHQTSSSPDGEGAYLAMTKALQVAGLQPADILLVNAHGTATPTNDSSESAALHRVFGERMPIVYSSKGMTGHTTSASGAIEMVFCLFNLMEPDTIDNVGFSEVDPQCIVPFAKSVGDKSLLGSMATNLPVRCVMCNGFGFGGNDSTVILRHDARFLLGDEVTSEVCDGEKEWENKTNFKMYVNLVLREVEDIDVKKYLNPMKTRRYNRYLKRSLVSALKAMELSGVSDPDAILNTTEQGNLIDTMKFADALATEGESASQPTHFMLSTQNVVASMIAIHTKNHGYNVTYCDDGRALQAALLDVFVQMQLGLIHTALVCANDGSDGKSAELYDVPDHYLAYMLSTEPSESPVAEVTSVGDLMKLVP